MVGTAKEWSRWAGRKASGGGGGGLTKVECIYSYKKVQKTPETQHCSESCTNEPRTSLSEYKRTLILSFRVASLSRHLAMFAFFVQDQSDFVIFIGAALPLNIQH